jgi:hypothetical protein
MIVLGVHRAGVKLLEGFYASGTTKVSFFLNLRFTI